MNISKLLVETFQKEQPDFVASIKMAVELGESRVNFIAFVKRVFENEFETSCTAQLAITIFDYYKEVKNNKVKL